MNEKGKKAFLGKTVRVIGGGSYSLDRKTRGKVGRVIPTPADYEPDGSHTVFVSIPGVTEQHFGGGIFVHVDNLRVLETTCVICGAELRLGDWCSFVEYPSGELGIVCRLDTWEPPEALTEAMLITLEKSSARYAAERRKSTSDEDLVKECNLPRYTIEAIRAAHAAFNELQARGKTPVIVGVDKEYVAIYALPQTKGETP